MKSLKRDAYVLGQVIDAMFVIFSAMLFNQTGTKVFIMPALFFSQIDSDISLESLISRDFVGIDFIFGASFFSPHWSLVFVDYRNERIIYLDTVITRYVPIQKINSDLAVIRTIIWYCVMNNSLDVPIPDKLPNWIVVDHQSFFSMYSRNLPPQEGGVDCGVFIVMYYVYIVSGEQFIFGTKDMPHIRKSYYR